jgi:tetratricopeptide (TPR) repeat protein
MTGNLQARARRRLALMPDAGVWGCLSLAVALAGPAAVQAQSLPVVSHPVVQPLPGEGQAAAPDPARMLANALAKLSRNPHDAEALVEAGNAAMDMGDSNAAAGFYARAEKASPGNPRVAAALAETRMRADDPVGAISWYEQAAQGGALRPELQADRGLAHDLVGDNATAQRIYREAIAGGAGMRLSAVWR